MQFIDLKKIDSRDPWLVINFYLDRFFYSGTSSRGVATADEIFVLCFHGDVDDNEDEEIIYSPLTLPQYHGDNSPFSLLVY